MKSNREAKRTARQLFRICMVDGRFSDERAGEVLAQFRAQGGTSSLGVLEAFTRLVRLEKARRHADVESATELAPALREEVLVGLRARYGDDITAAFTTNPALLGGLRIKLGSDVYDGSLRARLDQLASAFSA